MNSKLFYVALGIALTATSMSAIAQKTYTSGVVSYSTDMMGQMADVKDYFTADSSAAIITFGPGTVKILNDAKHDYLAVVLDISIANLKKVGIATAAELEEAQASYPSFTYAPSTETKQIAGFNCKKVIATDSKSKKTYTIWITNDVVVPSTATPFYYAGIGGFPVEFTTFQQGQGGDMTETDVTIKSITDDKAPAGTFTYPKDFEKGTLAELRQQ